MESIGLVPAIHRVKILSKYILREHMGPLMFALSALTSLLLLNYVAKRIGDLVGKGLGWRVIAEFLVMSIPFTVAMTVPMAVLVATLYVYSRLTSENEITSMRAGGVGMRALLGPTLCGAAFVAVAMLAFNDQVLPRANHQLAVLQSDILRKKPTFALREQVIDSVSPGLAIRAGKLAQSSGWMYDVTISDLRDPATHRTIYADSGELALTPDKRDLVLRLYSGEALELSTTDQLELRHSYFQSNRYVVRHVSNAFEKSDTENAYKSDREQTICDMYLEYARAERTYLISQAAERAPHADIPEPTPALTTGRIYCMALAGLFQVPGARSAVAPHSDSASAGDADVPAPIEVLGEKARAGIPPTPSALLSGGSVGQGALMTMNRYNVEIQKKFALAAACIVFVILGAPIALRFPRSGVGLVIGVSLVVFALYYVALIAGETLANRGYLAPFWAMWAANILMGSFGLVMLARIERQSSATRDTSFRETLDALRARLFRGRRASGDPADGAVPPR